MILSRKGIDLKFYFFNLLQFDSIIDAIDVDCSFFISYFHSISNSCVNYASVKHLLHFLIYKNTLFK